MQSLSMLSFAVLILASRCLAQRPDNVAQCDYYAEQRYGANNNETQFQLVQNIVVLAFGGRFNMSKYPSELTGILNPGIYNGQSVNLSPWFDGSKHSSNVNGHPEGINWLDGGGLVPLRDYVSGVQPNLQLNNTRNQFGLFHRFFVSFAQLFQCTLPPLPPPTPNGGKDSTTLNVAYVHQFMNLTRTDLEHFIRQLTLATFAVGFDDNDASRLGLSLEATFNVRCAPPIPIPPNPTPQLPSLCQDPSCPLAPSPDCAAYDDILPDGVIGGTLPSTAATPSSQRSTPTLSRGTIAGIAVGGACFLILLLAGANMLFRRYKRKARPVQPQYAPPPPSEYRDTMTSLAYTEPPYACEMPSPEMKKSQAMHPMAEMDSPVQSPYLSGTMGGLLEAVEMPVGEGREGNFGRRKLE